MDEADVKNNTKNGEAEASDCPCDNSEEDSLFDVVVKTSLKTLFYLFLSLSVIVSYLALRLPYNAMKASYFLGMYRNALAYSERLVKAEKQGERYAEGLLYAIELSDKFLTSAEKPKDKEKYARKLMEYTQKYAASPESVSQNVALDNFYRSNSSGKTRILLYSYENYVYCQNVRACAVLGLYDTFLFDGRQVSFSGLSTDGNVPQTLDKLALLYSQIYVYCSVDTTCSVLDVDPYNLYSLLKGTASVYLTESLKESGLLKRLYLINCAFELELALKKFCALRFTQMEMDSLEELFKVALKDNYISLWEYIDIMAVYLQ